MRHRKLGSKLGRSGPHRRAMFRNLVTSLLDHERVETTDAKAKAVRRLAERMITLGKRGTLHARRRALRVVRSRSVTAKLFADLAERYRERPGGYTRVVKTRVRRGDAAPLAVVELVAGEAGEAKATEPRGRRRKRPVEGGAAAAKPARGARAKAKPVEKGAGRTPRTKASRDSARAELAKGKAARRGAAGAVGRKGARKTTPKKGD